MAQQIINTGAVANDGTGDPLRTAFTETNNNFTEIYTAGPVDSNVRITDNTILTLNTNGNLVLAPNGTGVVQSNVSIVPNQANVRNLGSSTRRWSTLYLQYADISNTMTVGGGLTVGGNLTVSGNIIQVGNIITDSLTIQLGNTAANASAANGAGITVGANDNIATMLYSSAGNAWNMNIGLNTPNLVVNNISSDDSTFVTVQDGLDVQGDITAETVSTSGNITANYFIGNGSQLTGITSSYGNNNVATFLAAFGSNTISTSGNVTAGNILPTGYVSATGNVRGANFNTVGVVSATGNISGNYFIGNGSQLTGLSTNSISNGNSNVEIATSNGPVTVSYAGSGNTWTFGDVNVPEALYWPDGSFQATAFVGIAQDLANPGNATITSNNTGNTTYAWNFGTDGRLTFPGTPRIDTDANNFEVQAAENISFEANAAVNIYTDTSGTTYQWQFDANGNLNLPANGDLNFSAGGIYQAVDEDFRIRVQDADDDGWAVLQEVDDGAGNVLGLTQLRRDQFLVEFAGGGAPQFRFTNNGEMQLPGNVRWDNYQNQSLYAVADNNGNGTVELKTISYASDTLGSNIRVSQSNATISTGNAQHTWNFDNTGVLTFPSGVNIVDGAFNGTASSTVSLNALSPDGNTVSFQAQGNTSSAVISIFSNAGPVTSNWTFTTAPLDPSESFLYVPNGGAISTPDATGGEGGKNIFIQAGASDPVTWNSNPGGELFIKGGYGSFGDGGGGPGGNVYIEGGLSSDSHAGNVYLTTGLNNWVFDYSGNLTVPGNIVMPAGSSLVGNGASPAPNISGFNSATFGANVTATGNITGGNISTGGLVSATGNITGGNIVTAGNVSGNTAGYAIGYRDIPQVSFTGNATIATTDAGKHFYSTQSTDYILTIANNASQGFQVGAAITIVNQGSGNITIAQGAGVTLYLAGNASSGNRSVATFGMATIMKVDTNTWFINGTGVS